MNDYTTQFIIDTCNKIMDAITNDDHINMLNNTSLIMDMFGKDFIKKNKLEDIKKKINKTLTNETNMRILRLMQTIKTEVDTRVEYYDKDRGQDERLFYQKEMEEEMIEFQKQIRNTLSIILKEIGEESLEI